MVYIRRKSRAPAKKSTTKKRSYRKVSVRRPRRVAKSLNYLDTTIAVMNPGRDPIIRMTKSMPLNVPYQIGGATKGVNFQMGTTALTWGQVMVFDPSGTRGNICGTVTANSTLLGAGGIAEWAALALLYTQYKVKKVHLKFNCHSNAGNLDTEPPTMYIRYVKEWTNQPGTPGQVTPGILAEQRNIVKKTFTSQHPDFQYSFYPKVAMLSDSDGTSTISQDSRVFKSMPFTNVSTPVDLWGLQIFVYWPGNASHTAIIQMDVTYDLEFRTQH